MSVCLPLSLSLFPSLSLSLRYLLYQLTVILCVCLFVSMPPCVWEQGQICAGRSEVGFVAKCFNQLMGRAACLVGAGHSCCVKRALTEDLVASQTCLIWLVFALLNGYPFWALFVKKTSLLYLISNHISQMCRFLSQFHINHMCLPLLLSDSVPQLKVM